MRESLAAIEHLDGEVDLMTGLPEDGELNSTASFMVLWNAYSKPKSIAFYSPDDYELPDTIFSSIYQLGNIRDLSLLGSDVSDDDIERIVRIKTLENLDLTATDVSDAGLKLLKAKLPNTIITCVRPNEHGLIVL